MARPEPNEPRGRLRVWLKMALQSGQLDRIPPEYEPDGPGSGVPARAYARELLAALQAAEGGSRAPGEVVAAIRSFRAWVDAHQKTARRLILAEEEGPVLRLDPGKRPLAPPPPPAAPPRRPRGGETPRTLLDHPLWDRWLDG